MVDPEEHLVVTQTAYVVPAPTASPPLAANPVPINDRMDVLVKALRLVQGKDHQSYQFRDLYLFPEAALPSKFHISVFGKYNGRGCPILHLKMYYGDLAQLQADERLLIRLF